MSVPFKTNYGFDGHYFRVNKENNDVHFWSDSLEKWKISQLTVDFIEKRHARCQRLKHAGKYVGEIYKCLN